jgi:hypothetical protein
LALKPEKTWVFCWAWFFFGDFFEFQNGWRMISCWPGRHSLMPLALSFNTNKIKRTHHACWHLSSSCLEVFISICLKTGYTPKICILMGKNGKDMGCGVYLSFHVSSALPC